MFTHLLGSAPRESVRPRYPQHVDVSSVSVVEAGVVESVGVDAAVESLGSLQGELHAVQGAGLADCKKNNSCCYNHLCIYTVGGLKSP